MRGTSVQRDATIGFTLDEEHVEVCSDGRLHGGMTHDGDVVLHILQGCLQYVEELISWIRLFGYDDDDLGGWLPGWYIVEDNNDFR